MPRGPLFESKRYKIKPKATVGIPIIELKKPLASLFPGKDESPITNAMGKPQRQESKVANPEIYSDLSAIESTSGSPPKIRPNA